MMGQVTLLGAGPGDVGLMTVRGAQVLARADVVIYDFLADPAFLAMANPAADRMYVGKSGAMHTMEQAEINELMVDQARQGKRVVRLKGGDPYIFGRGGEEAEFLAERGIPFAVIPGIASALGASAYAGIPLTDRKFASSVTFVTGHEDPSKVTTSINWKALAETGGTLVVYMGIRNISLIADLLMQNGRSGTTPVAVVQWATQPYQRSVQGTLATVAGIVETEKIEHPALIIVGEVVGSRRGLNWFENLPLFGKTIAVTRAVDQAGSLVELLGAQGARLIQAPAIRIEPPADWMEVDESIQRLGSYDWTVFTSVNGVKAFCGRLLALGYDARHFGAGHIAAIGEPTAEALLAYGLKADYVPKVYTSASLADGLAVKPGDRVLLARADIGTAGLRVSLVEKGAVVDDVAVYRTLAADFDVAALRDALADGRLQGITFTSASTVRSFLEKTKAADLVVDDSSCALFSIGPETSQALREAGLAPAREAGIHTIPGLVDAILDYYRRTRGAKHD